jgi:hypothetical protein
MVKSPLALVDVGILRGGAALEVAERGAAVDAGLRAFDLGELQLHIAQLLFQDADAWIAGGGLLGGGKSGCRQRDQRRAGQEKGKANLVHHDPVENSPHQSLCGPDTLLIPLNLYLVNRN